MRPNLLLFQKLESGSSFSLVLASSDLHLVSIRGSTEPSTAFNSSMFEELRNLSLIEPLNSFKNSSFFLGFRSYPWFLIRNWLAFRCGFCCILHMFLLSVVFLLCYSFLFLCFLCLKRWFLESTGHKQIKRNPQRHK